MSRPIEILLVEDNPGDVRLTQEVLKEGKVANRLTVLPDGVEALAYLHGEGRYKGRTLPDIIFLDLNMPRKDGREVLAEVKSDQNLRYIPVVVLTTSEAAQDIARCYDLHANCYLTKPVELDEFIKTITAIESFWLTLVRMPSEG